MFMTYQRRVLVTGASDGIGGAVCRIFAQNAKTDGVSIGIVISTSGNKPAPETLIEELNDLGASVKHVSGDLAQAQTAQLIASTCRAFLGGLDVLVANAGAVSPAPLADLTIENWDRLIDINVRSTWLLAQELKDELTQSRGNIVAVGSTSGLMPHVGHGSYSASKAALTMLIRQIAQEWAHLNIRANMIAPGLVETPLTRSVYDNEDLRKARELIVPLGRIGQPQDMAEAIAFLSSNRASYITGQVLTIDGGIADASLLRIPGLPAKNN